MCLSVAHDCNLACKYCFAEEGEYHGRRALMSFEVGKKALDFLVANSGNRVNLEVDFFGGKANVSRSAAAFAVHAGCPIVVAAMSRKNGRHVFNHMATLRPDPAAADRKEEARRLTRKALKILSDEVMENPGDWYWFNKRWILEPPEGDSFRDVSFGPLCS